MTFRCYSYALHVVNFINGSDMFRSVYLQIFCVSTHHSFSNEMALYMFGHLVGPELCCHHCRTIELHSTGSLGTTPNSITNFLTQTSSFVVVKTTIYSAFVCRIRHNVKYWNSSKICPLRHHLNALSLIEIEKLSGYVTKLAPV